MRNIKFKKLGMKNFKCYTTEFELQIEDGKLILICGPNAIGKTTIFDVIPYTLYASTASGLKGDDVVNDIVQKNCHTWVEWTDEETKYRVDRFCKDSKYGNGVYLRRNGIEIKTGQREVVSEVEKLLVPRKLFLNTILFAQKVKSFFTELTDTERKELFRKILQIENYIIYHKEASNRISTVEQDILEAQNEIVTFQKMLVNYNDQIVRIENESQIFYTEKDKFINSYNDQISLLTTKKESFKTKLLDVSQIENELEKIRNEISNLESQEKVLHIEVSNLKEEVKSKLDVKINEIKSKSSESKNNILGNYRNKVNELQKNFMNVKSDLESQISEVRIRKETIILETKTKGTDKQKLLEQLQEYDNNLINTDLSVCPTCGQEVSDDVKSKLLLSREDIRKEISDIDRAISNLNQEKNNIQNKLLQLNNSLQSENIKFSKSNSELQKQENNEISELNTKVNELISKVTNVVKEKLQTLASESIEKARVIKSKIEELKNQKIEIQNNLDLQKNISNEISDINSKINTFSILIEEKNNQEFNYNERDIVLGKIDNLKNNIEKHKLNIHELDEKRDILMFWKVGFSKSGIESMLIDESIPFINQRISEYQNQISNGRYLVSFDTLSTDKSGENFKDKTIVRVVDTITKSDKREKLSGGQERLIDISVILTLCDLQSQIQGISFNIILFDEIFDSLDDNNIANVSKLLRTLVRDKSVYLISHRHINQVDADDTLVFQSEE